MVVFSVDGLSSQLESAQYRRQQMYCEPAVFAEKLAEISGYCEKRQASPDASQNINMAPGLAWSSFEKFTRA